MRRTRSILTNILFGLIVVYFGATGTINTQWLIDDQGCPTPDNDVGTCLPLKHCKPLLNYLLSVSPPTPTIKKTVERYYCGVTSTFPKVCCPSNGKVLEVTPATEANKCTTPTITIPTTPTITTTTQRVVLESHQKEIETCTTPTLSEGMCVPVKECQPIIDFITKSSPLGADDIQKLRAYQCPNSDKVCCPDDSFVPITKSPNLQTPPNISNHRNLNLLPTECGPLVSDRIVFGNKTALFEYPWMALLSYRLANSDTDFRCGGTVINDWYILTAAHCLAKRSTLKLIGVRVGESDISTQPDCEEKFGTTYCATPVQDIAIAEAIAHPRYNTTTLEYDIGLIRLAQRINSTVDSVKPVCLPTTSELRNKNLENMNLTVTGWGVTETGKRSPQLLQVNVPVVPEDQCRQAYEGQASVIVSRRQICAGGKTGGDSCGGDSGGPLQAFFFHNDDARYIQFGVVSFGPRFCGQEGYPGVYTRVDYYMDWILDNIKNLG